MLVGGRERSSEREAWLGTNQSDKSIGTSNHDRATGSPE